MASANGISLTRKSWTKEKAQARVDSGIMVQPNSIIHEIGHIEHEKNDAQGFRHARNHYKSDYFLKTAAEVSS